MNRRHGRTNRAWRLGKFLAAGLAFFVGCDQSGHAISRPDPSIDTHVVAVAPLPATPTVVRAERASPDKYPVPIIVLSGTASDIGRQHGQALGASIRALHDSYFQRYFKNPGQRWLALGVAQTFDPRLSPEHHAELAALAADAGIDTRQLLLAQCFLDLTPMTACSTIALPAGAAPDGVARFGRNLDFPGFNIADKQTVVLVYRPEGRYQFAAISWPGLLGVLSGMNEHGLAIANMEVARYPRAASGMPYTLLYRTVLERCRTVDEAIALLKNTPRQSANNLMLMDASGDRAVAEITPEGVTVRRASGSQALISTNHQRGASNADSPGRCTRYDRLHDAARDTFGLIDCNAVEQMLANVAQGNKTLQSMVFEPSTRVIYLATGKNAPTNGYASLDLNKYFIAPVQTAAKN